MDIKSAAVLSVGGLIVFGLFKKKYQKKPVLKWFHPEEFGGWYQLVDNKLLKKLDELRERWGYPINISQHHEAVGRHWGDSESRHNVEKKGYTDAVDIFPMFEGRGLEGDEINKFYNLCRELGFGGIGIYTDTSQIMFHVDTRPRGLNRQPALWSRVNGTYLGINEVLA